MEDWERAQPKQMLAMKAAQDGFSEYLQETDKERNQESIEAFAMHVTNLDSNTYHGLSQKQLIAALGGTNLPF